MRDVEGEEVFLVISGTGRIEFDEPDCLQLNWDRVHWSGLRTG